MSDTGEERTLFREGTAVAHYCEGVHLETVVVMEAERIVTDDPRVEPEPARLKTVAAARMAAVQHRHVVFLRHRIDRIEQAQEVLLRVYVLLPVGAQQNVSSFFETETFVNIRGFYLRKVLVKNLRHRGAGDICALPREPALRQVTPRMFAVGHVHIRDNVHDPSVGLLRQALVLTAVARLHVEDRDVQPLRAYHTQTAVRVPEHQDRIGLRRYEKFVAAVDDVPAGGPEVIPHCIHVHLRGIEFQILEEHSVEVVVVVLSGVGEDHIEIPPAFADDRRKADDFRPRAHDDHEFESAVILELYVRIVEFRLSVFHMTYCFSTGSKYVSGRSGSKVSLAYITVTRSCVSERLMML